MDICIGDAAQHAPSDPGGGGKDLSNLMGKVECRPENVAHPPQLGGKGIGVGLRKASDILNERTDNLVRRAVD